jgi:hypothetical protein
LFCCLFVGGGSGFGKSGFGFSRKSNHAKQY